MSARRLALVMALGVLATACVPAGPGHLSVPRDVAVCAPAESTGQTLFGVLVTNAGKHPITITKVHADDTANVDEVSIMVDREGPALDDVVGTVRNPAEDPADQPRIDALLGRLVGVENALVVPGEAANLIVTIIPADAQADAVVGLLKVTYSEYGRDHTVNVDQSLTLTTAPSC